jgi:hypothetical protein
MAEAAKQFFVGFIHPRTWLAALLGLVAAFVTALIVAFSFSAAGSALSEIANDLFGGSTAAAEIYLTLGFGYMIQPYSLLSVSLGPIIVLVVGGLVGGLIFGLTSKKERVASKSIIGGLNIAVIYLLITVVALVFWIVGFSGFEAYGTAVWNFLTALWIDILVSFLIVWWVAALISILILSMKHD